MDEFKKFSLSLFLFGIVFSLILYFKAGKIIATSFLFTMILISFLSFVNKKIATSIKNSLKYIGGKIATFALFLVYLIAIIPTKFFAVIIKRDRLNLKKQNKESFWINTEEKENNWDLQY